MQLGCDGCGSYFAFNIDFVGFRNSLDLQLSPRIVRGWEPLITLRVSILSTIHVRGVIFLIVMVFEEIP